MIKLTRKSYPRSYTESIEERLREAEEKQREIEAEMHKKDQKIRELETMSHSNGPSPRDAGTPRVYTPGARVPGSRDNRAQAARNTMEDSVSLEVGRMNSDRNGVGRFMGASSGIYFVGLAQQRFSTLTDMPWRIGHELLRVEEDDQSMEYQIHPVVLRKDFLGDLPPHDVAVGLADEWFEAWRYIFPILHRPTFMRNLELMYFKKQTVPDRDIPAEIFAIFYLVLALGSRQVQVTGKGVSGRPDIRSSGSDVIYFEKAMSYYGEVVQLGTVRTIQFQELLTLWYVSTGKRSLASQTIASVARLSLELGLHHHSKRFNFNPLTTEIRKRTFWVCYILDSYLSAVAGVPRALRDQDIDTDQPSNVEDDYVSSAGYLPSRTFGMIAFVSLVKVSRVLAQAQELLYTTISRSETFAKMSSLGRLLNHWEASLPEHMRMDWLELRVMTPEEAAADLGKGAPEVVFTQLIWLYAKLLVYRPALSFRQPNESMSAALTHLEHIPDDIILLLSLHPRFLLSFDINPACHAYTLYQCALMVLYIPHALRDTNDQHYMGGLSKGDPEARKSALKCLELLDFMRRQGRVSEAPRIQNLRDIIALIESGATTTADTSNVSSAGHTPVATPSAQALSPSSRFLSFSSNSGRTPVAPPKSPYTQPVNPPPKPNPLPGVAIATGTLPALKSFPGYGEGLTVPFEFQEYIHPYDRLLPETVTFTSGLLHHGYSSRPIKDVWEDEIFSMNPGATGPVMTARASEKRPEVDSNATQTTAWTGGTPLPAIAAMTASYQQQTPQRAYQPAHTTPRPPVPIMGYDASGVNDMYLGPRGSKRKRNVCGGICCGSLDCEDCWDQNDPEIQERLRMRDLERQRQTVAGSADRPVDDCHGAGCGNCTACLGPVEYWANPAGARNVDMR